LDRIFSAAYLVTADAPPLEGGALLSRDGRIAAVGTLADLASQNPEAAVSDFGEGILAPLLVNAHTHLELTDFPTWAAEAGEAEEPKDFVDWILRLIRVKRSLSKKLFPEAIASGLAELLKSGTGAVGDILSHYPSRTVYQDSPLLGTVFLESLGQDPQVIQRIRTGLNEILEKLPFGLVEYGISPHSPYSISASYLSSLYSKCRKEGLRCATHLAESQAEVDFVRSSSGGLATRFYPAIGWESLIPWPAGCSPTEYLQKRGGLFPENLLVHGVQLTAADIDLLGEAGMHLALCPRSNAHLDVGKAPVAALQKAGVKLTFGTDSLASSPSLSVWDEMSFAHTWFDGQLDAPTLFRMATRGGAEALGVEKDLGSLTFCKQCSFQLLRPKTLPTVKDFSDYLVAPGRTEEIEKVFVCGELKYDSTTETGG